MDETIGGYIPLGILDGIGAYQLDGDTVFLRDTFSFEDLAEDASSFNPIIGYGFADAAGAVAKAINQETFPSVPNFGGINDWNINMVNAPEAWEQGYTGSGIVVAVVDTGVDRNHVDLRDNIWTNSNEIPDNGIDDDNNGFIDDVFGWNFNGDNNDTLDVRGHGTHVSGTIAGNNNGDGVTGVAYDAQIMPVKVLNNLGIGNATDVAEGIRYAVDNGANVINLSLGGDTPSKSQLLAIEYAANNGVIVVMAAGNESEPESGKAVALFHLYFFCLSSQSCEINSL